MHKLQIRIVIGTCPLLDAMLVQVLAMILCLVSMFVSHKSDFRWNSFTNGAGFGM